MVSGITRMLKISPLTTSSAFCPMLELADNAAARPPEVPGFDGAGVGVACLGVSKREPPVTGVDRIFCLTLRRGVLATPSSGTVGRVDSVSASVGASDGVDSVSMPISFLMSARLFSLVAATCKFLLFSRVLEASLANMSFTFTLPGTFKCFMETEVFDLTSSTIACKTPGYQRVTLTFASGCLTAAVMASDTSAMRSSTVLVVSASSLSRNQLSCTKISVIRVESTPRGCHDLLSITSRSSELRVDIIFGMRPHDDLH
mmetsp:Transcript_12146/g.24707  ORF Transcript_12146/g.24707 Transcript_12146/m.24707 type:complete len:259 (+) Transcript_12146:342-1118(+)